MCEDWCAVSRNHREGSQIPKVYVCGATQGFSLRVDGRDLSCKKSIRLDLIDPRGNSNVVIIDFRHIIPITH